MHNPSEILPVIKKLHCQIREAVIKTCENSAQEQLSRIDREADDDTIYAIDRVSEELLISFFEQEIAHQTPIILIAEGLANEGMVLPKDAKPEAVKWRIIIDPIDGTRGLMYQKRPAWILTGVAPNNGPETSFRDIVCAVQTEIPLVKQHLSDMLWAVRGKGAKAVRFNRLTGEEQAFTPRPLATKTIAHGFATISRFFPGGKDILAKIDDLLAEKILGKVEPGKAKLFEDQYISNGGQLYELMAGHDCFVADLRPLLEPLLQARGDAHGITCHPYDICTELIARELGVIITDHTGAQLDVPLNLSHPVTWLGYANAAIREQVEQPLQEILRQVLGS